MRVALLDPPSFTAPYDHALAAALASRGHDVHLLTSPFSFGEPPAPVDYRREEVFLPLSARLLRRSPRSRLRFAVKALEYGPSVLRLRGRLARLAPDVVHVQWLAEPRLDVNWLRGLTRRRPTVLTAHDVVPRLSRNVEAWDKVLGIVDRIVVHSHRAAEQLAELGIPPGRIVRIPHPIFASPPGFEVAPPAGATLLFFGLLRQYKGVDVLLRAFARIAAEVPNARLRIAGDPVDPIGPLRQLAETLGIAPRVEWRLGFLPDEAIAPLMRDATLVALPYRRIDSSGVLATALGFGRPAVVSDLGGVGDTVREFGAGLAVPPDDEAALAAACVTLLTDKAALADAFRGAQRARATLTWEAAAEAHEHLYEGVLAERA